MTIRRISLGRCPAPAHTKPGTIRCVLDKNRCTNAGHDRWRRVTWLMAVVWWVKPWWPNDLGRRMDREGRERSADATK